MATTTPMLPIKTSIPSSDIDLNMIDQSNTNKLLDLLLVSFVF